MFAKPSYEELEDKVRFYEERGCKHQLLEKEQLMTLEVLQLINETESLKDLLLGLIKRLSDWTGCEAVAIRLKDGPDFPYYVTTGFSERFVELERRLCSYDENGEPILDENGAPRLDCMCGNILQGRFDPSKNFFTGDGCFWSNCTTNLLSTTTDADRQARTRNRCNSSGYESVALIPLRSARETFGLIQLNDFEENRFSPELIAMYRRIADNIAAFLAKRQAREALVRSERNLRTLIDTLPDLIWMKSPEGVYLACNKRFESFFGAREEDILGKTDYDFLDMEKAEFFRRHDQLAVEAGKPRMNEEEIVFAEDGHRELLETIKTPIFDDQGNLTGVLGIARDITSHKQAEQVLKENTEQMGLFIKHMPAAIAMFDLEMNYLAASTRWMEDFNISDQNVIGRCHYDIFPELKEELKEIHRRGLAGEVMRDDDTHFERLDGTVQRVRWEMLPWYKRDNSIGGIVILTEDITKTKNAETEKEKLREQLLQSQKIESVGRLAGGVAHDLNNLLTPVLGFGEMLQEDIGYHDHRREFVNEILSAGERARVLVRQLLAFSRKQTLEFKPVSINVVINEFFRLLRRTIPEDIDIQIDTSQDSRLIMADVGQIEQVIMNLAVNSADAMPEGGKLLIATTLEQDEDLPGGSSPKESSGLHIKLSVTDTGCGMDEETQKQIFEPFFSTKGELGTGLGLSTVYGIVKQHGGSIQVNSEVGKGTAFSICLPIVYSVPQENKKVKTTASGSRGEETIILAEDNEQVRKLAKAILTRQGYNVITLKSMEDVEATLASQSEPVDLLLTDVVMPGMNGRELFEKIHKDYPNMKVLFMSGYSGNVLTDRGVQEQNIRFLQKPFTSSALLIKVREALDEN